MKRIAAAALSLALAGCVTVPPKTFLVSEQQLQKRQIETRKYDGINEKDLLVASSINSAIK